MRLHAPVLANGSVTHADPARVAEYATTIHTLLGALDTGALAAQLSPFALTGIVAGAQGRYGDRKLWS
jgi:hypothetical protein